MVGCAARVAKPDAALRLNLLQVRAAVSGEDERNLVLVPRPTRKHKVGRPRDIRCVAFRLVDGGGDVLPLALSLDKPDQCRVHEQGVVGRAAGCGPLRNGQIVPLGRSRPRAVAQQVGICLPPCVAELLVDQGACGGFVKVDLLGSFLTPIKEIAGLRLRGLFSRRLQSGKP